MCQEHHVTTTRAQMFVSVIYYGQNMTQSSTTLRRQKKLTNKWIKHEILGSHDTTYVFYWDITLCSMVDAWFYHEDGGSRFLQNVSIYCSLYLPDYIAS
jgi:hypothetical protein